MIFIYKNYTFVISTSKKIYDLNTSVGNPRTNTARVVFQIKLKYFISNQACRRIFFALERKFERHSSDSSKRTVHLIRRLNFIAFVSAPRVMRNMLVPLRRARFYMYFKNNSNYLILFKYSCSSSPSQDRDDVRATAYANLETRQRGKTLGGFSRRVERHVAQKKRGRSARRLGANERRTRIEQCTSTDTISTSAISIIILL